MTSTDPAAQPTIRQRVRKFVDHPTFQKTIMTLIVINAVTLGFETSPTIMGYIGPALQVFDKIVIAIFCVEIVLRIYAHGPAFFRDPWGIFDFIVVAITLTPSNDPVSASFITCVTRVETSFCGAASAANRQRSPARSSRSWSNRRATPSGILRICSHYDQTIRSCFSRLVRYHRHSMFTLFQVMTLESWSMGIVRPVMEGYSWAWIVFVAFIVLSSFTVLNLFIAIIIDSMQTLHDTEKQETVSDVNEFVQNEHLDRAAEFEELKREMGEIKNLFEGTAALISVIR